MRRPQAVLPAATGQSREAMHWSERGCRRLPRPLDTRFEAVSRAQAEYCSSFRRKSWAA